MKSCYLLCSAFAGFVLWSEAAITEEPQSVGFSKVDITPSYPIRLSGYGSRRTESEGVAQRLWTKAIAFGGSPQDAAVFMTVDNCAVSASLIDEVANRLARTEKLQRERLAICSTHTHSAPCLSHVIPNLFSQDIIVSEQATIHRYTKELVDAMEKAARQALAARQPSFVAWGQGKVAFARNRRTAGGPVDHTFSLLRVTDTNGTIRGILGNYACHCTTLGGEFNQVHGDWAGCAQESLEGMLPQAIALISIGCGADANPNPRGKTDHAQQHGAEITAETKRLLAGKLHSLSGPLICKSTAIELPFQTLPTRAQWEERAQKPGIVGYHARKNLARLDRGEKLPTHLPYRVQTWSFGEDLAMVFLPGEVVVDYSLRLKKAFDPTRLWINAYANDVPCYIPSKRILEEGGYEAEDSLWYYDRPARLAPETEDLIIKAVHELIPKPFRAARDPLDFPAPKSPAQALASFRTRPELQIELAAAEPLIVDPVAIDFGADGKLWVVEMHDYPSGVEGKPKGGGRVKFLEDNDADGRYDTTTLFLDELPFPTGIMAWGKGALVCAAPDILLAEDLDSDGKAETVKKLFSGFATHNFQARVNGLSVGLDNWVYGAAGLFGGKIYSSLTGKETKLEGQDFRFLPDTGAFEPVSGLSQQGRVRDDWGNWFGNDNSTLIWHFPLPDHYARRNPHVTTPEPAIRLAKDVDANRVYPASRTLERFNDPGHLNRVTSACGLEIYRDRLLGEQFYGNAFICEPVHNLVHRLVLQPDGVTFGARRAAGEKQSEFLSSTDNWFRPVQVRTGPDGALWVVDMYRFVVEHPRWIPPERLAQLDVRAGDDKGRIYRVFSKSKKPKAVPNIRNLQTSELVHALDTQNGPVRDLVQRELIFRRNQSVIPALLDLAATSHHPEVRVQALWSLNGLRALTSSALKKGLADKNPQVRRGAIALSEHKLNESPALGEALLNLVNDAEPNVRFQLALTLGEWDDQRAGAALSTLAGESLRDRWLCAAVLSSATRHASGIFPQILRMSAHSPPPIEFAGHLISTAAGANDPGQLRSIFLATAGQASGTNLWQLQMIGALIRALERKNLTLQSYGAAADPELRMATERIKMTCDRARELVLQDNAPTGLRAAALRLFGTAADAAEIRTLCRLLQPGSPGELRQAGLDMLGKQRSPKTASILLERWNEHSPAIRQSLLGILVNRAEWASELLKAVEKGEVALSEIRTDLRQRLLNYSDKEIKTRASSLLNTRTPFDNAALSRRSQAIKQLPGTAPSGSSVFEKNCASCHLQPGKGDSVGPDLNSFSHKGTDDFLLAILDPNAAVEPRFIGYEVETTDGRMLAGVALGETATAVTLVQPGGTRERLLRTEIKNMKASNVSLMPEGLEQGMTDQDFADLIAYLRKPAPPLFGGATVQQAAEARAQFRSSSAIAKTRIISAAEKRDYPSWLGALPLAHCRQTDGRSRVIWEVSDSAARPEGEAGREFTFPAAMGFQSQPAGNFQLQVNGQDALEFDVTLSDRTWQNDDGSIRLRYEMKEKNSEDSNGLLMICVPPSLAREKSIRFQVTGSAGNSQRWFGIYDLQADDLKHASK